MGNVTGLSAGLLEVLACSIDGAPLESVGEELRCSSCGTTVPVKDGSPRFFGLMEPRYAPESVAKARTPSTWSSWRWLNYRFLESYVRALPESARVLDLGAGPGHFGDLLRPFGHYGADFQPYPDVDIVTDLTQRLPLRDSSFTMVILSNVLEHIPCPQNLLKEAYRVLSPSGRLVMMTPFCLPIHQAPYDFLRFTGYMFEHMARESGFTPEVIEPLGNIVDVYLDFAYHYMAFTELRSRSLRLRRWTAKALMYMASKLYSASRRAVGRKRLQGEDEIGLPQGYGVVYRKD